MTNLPPRYKNIFNKSKESHQPKAQSANHHHSYYIQQTSRAKNPERLDSQTIINKSHTYNKQSRNGTWSEVQVIQDIVQVLKQENLNLKDQNQFLLQKLRAISKRQEEARNSAMTSQSLSKDIRRQNQHIKSKIQEVNTLASIKVEQFGKKLLQLSVPQFSTVKKIDNIESQTFFSDSKSPEKGVCSEYKNKQYKNLNEVSLHDQMHQEFNYLLALSKMQQDPLKKKEYRKKLVELTNKMKQLRN